MASLASVGGMRHLNIHEYQSKMLMDKHGVKIQRWRLAESVDDVKKAVKDLGTVHSLVVSRTDARALSRSRSRVLTGSRTDSRGHVLVCDEYVVKAQIHAGGRGKGVFSNGYKGGVRVCSTAADAIEAASNMLGNTLVTKQTGPDGVPVRKVLPSHPPMATVACALLSVACRGPFLLTLLRTLQVMIVESIDFSRELYFAILLDRAFNGPVMVVSPKGGMDIEAVAEETPDEIFKVPIDINKGPEQAQLEYLASKLNFTGKGIQTAALQMKRIYDLFSHSDATMVEVNPLVERTNGDGMALPFEWIDRSIL